MSVQYRVVSTDDGRWGLQAKDFGFWWRNVGSEVNEGVIHLTTFDTAAEARAWIDRQQNPGNPAAYDRGWKDGYGEGYDKATKAELKARRAALRAIATHEKPQGIPAGKEG